MEWNTAIAVEPLGEGSFRAHVDEHWRSLQGVHGGIVAALAVRASESVVAGLGADPSTSLRSATFGYVRGNVIGDIELEVDVVRQGRNLVSTHVRTVQDGRTTTVARLHHSPPWDGAAFSDVEPPPSRPEGTVLLRWGDEPAHLNNVETHLHPDTTMFAGAERAEWLAWSRPMEPGADGRRTFDHAWLTMFGDYFPPAVFTRATEPARAVTIEYSIQIHHAEPTWTLESDEFLTARMHAVHSHDGFAVEDGWIWLPDGSLLATTRQTRLAG